MRDTGSERCIAQVREVLTAFAEGYRLKDVQHVEEFVSSMFVPGGDRLVIGTGEGECLFSLDDIREMVESDWLYWGDVAIDVPGAKIVAQGDTAWFAAQATWTKEFDAGDVYRRAAEGVRKNLHAEMPDLVKTLFLPQGPLHVLLQMERGAKCVSPLRLTGVLVRSGDGWRFSRMQFSFPAPWMPDVRLTTSGPRLTPWDSNKQMDDARRALSAWRMARTPSQPSVEVEGILRELQKMHDLRLEGFPSHVTPTLFASDCLCCDVRSVDYRIGPDAAYEMIRSHLAEWDSVDLGFADAVISIAESGNAVWVASIGLARKTIAPAESYRKTLSRIGSMLEGEATAKVKLVEVVRAVARAALDAEGGPDYAWPLRFEAVLTREGDAWRYRLIQYSFPSDWSPPEVRL